LAEKRWMSIASSVRSAIRSGKLASGDRIATETELATQWNVSPVTVHRELSELRQEGWVVRRPRTGTIVAERLSLPTSKIALVFPNSSFSPQNSYLSGIEESLAENYQIIPMNSSGGGLEEANCLERAASECSAVICYPVGAVDNIPILNKISAAMPLVLVDRMPEGVEADTIMTDNFGSMMMGLNHLKQLGHQRIAYFMENQENISSVNQRRRAYVEFMDRECPGHCQRWLGNLIGSQPHPQYLTNVETLLANLLMESDPITAVACQQDSVLEAVIESAIRLRLRLPDDLTLLSFYDSGAEIPMKNTVHRLVQRSTEMGHMAARRVHQRLHSPSSTPPQVTMLMTDLYSATTRVLSPAALKFLGETQ
jgi:GntR family transcriptional regulator of arabinose operon